MSTAKKPDLGLLPPPPPLPKWMLARDDQEFQEAEALTPEAVRGKMQLQAVMSLDVLEWHARNMADPKSSIAAAAELLDRAGYVAPAKSKSDFPVIPGCGGEPLPSLEDDMRKLGEYEEK